MPDQLVTLHLPQQFFHRAERQLDLVGDVATAGDLREALAAGNISPRLARTLADSIGLDAQAQERRLEKRMQDQLAAEAMEGFPEIAEEARGRIPHPETLRKENHPLAGEVRPVAHGGLRLRESAKLGFEQGYGPEDTGDRSPGLNYRGLRQLANLVDRVMSNP